MRKIKSWKDIKAPKVTPKLIESMRAAANAPKSAKYRVPLPPHLTKPVLTERGA